MAAFEVDGGGLGSASWGLLAQRVSSRDRPLPRWRDPTEAMSSETYKTILDAQGRANNDSFVLHGPDDEYTQEQLFLRQDLAQNKAVWVGDFSRDLWYYLSNMNPILASFYSHPLHPISRTQRFIVYAISVLFVSNIAASVTLAEQCDPCGFDTSYREAECRPGFHGYPESHNFTALVCSQLEDETEEYMTIHNTEHFLHHRLPKFCCNSHRFGALWFWETFPHFGGSIFGFLANLTFSLTCFQLMMCPCVQQQSMRCRQVGERVGIVVFVILAIMTFAFSKEIIGDVFHLSRWKQMVTTFLCTKLMSWLGASVFNVSLFVLLFWVQNPKIEGSRWRWLDAPTDRQEVDARPTWVRGVNARFHVLASEHKRWGGCLAQQHIEAELAPALAEPPS